MKSTLFILSIVPLSIAGAADQPRTVVAQAQAVARVGGIIAEGATLQKLSGGFQFTEGPTAIGTGMSTSPISPMTGSWNGARTENSPPFKEPAGRANGMYFDPKDLWACAMDEK